MRWAKGFTLLEMVVVIGIITLLTAIFLPALTKVRSAVRKTIGKNNLKQIASSVSLYECDYNSYPSTSAYIECGSPRTWLEPTAMINYEFTGPRSIAHYLENYIDDAEIMYCPSAPGEFKYIQDAWEAGNSWDNPDTMRINDPLFGTYSFWWNYRGWLSEKRRIFMGPKSSFGGRDESKLVASCTFATTPNPYNINDYGDFISCEQFKQTGKTPVNSVASPMWNRLGSSNISRRQLNIKLNAGYTDGHVGQFNGAATTDLKISMSPNGGFPYFPSNLRGSFFVPLE